jgi:hypothetical protein
MVPQSNEDIVLYCLWGGYNSSNYKKCYHVAALTFDSSEERLLFCFSPRYGVPSPAWRLTHAGEWDIENHGNLVFQNFKIYHANSRILARD